MSVTYAIFQAELKSSLRKNWQALKKRIIGTFIIFFVGIFFSLACIRLIKFVIDNPQLFPEGSTQGYGTLLLIFLAGMQMCEKDSGDKSPHTFVS